MSLVQFNSLTIVVATPESKQDASDPGTALQIPRELPSPPFTESPQLELGSWVTSNFPIPQSPASTVILISESDVTVTGGWEQSQPKSSVEQASRSTELTPFSCVLLFTLMAKPARAKGMTNDAPVIMNASNCVSFMIGCIVH